jgi:hypothetical protein
VDSTAAGLYCFVEKKILARAFILGRGERKMKLNNTHASTCHKNVQQERNFWAISRGVKLGI